MTYTFLPGTDLRVSTICLGTMTFGQQNTEADGHAQLDYALSQGITFIDTAEMYPVPAVEATYGATEAIIGSWLKKQKRDDLVLASKIAGPNRGLPYIRDDLRYTPETLRLSLEKSLRRLQTDYLDLYQLHWPARKSNMFGQLGFTIQDDAWEDNIASLLRTVADFQKEGKIRHFGLSNETPWGVMRFVEESRRLGLPKAVTTQNPYSLVNRTFEIGLSEVCHREGVGLLAYSPLGFGTLTGKYLDGTATPEARLNQFPRFVRYNSDETAGAIRLYAELARDHGLTPVQMALAFVRQQAFVTATIVGATSLQQLEEDCSTVSVQLPETVWKGIEAIHRQYPNPAP
jgi:aryl-alcohol dehydrogenase-like predicted oxidoreductase